MTRALILTALLSLFMVGLPTTAEANAGSWSPQSSPHYTLTGMNADQDQLSLLVKLQMAQFHHLRAMHGIGWSLVGLLTSPGLALFGGGVMIAGAIGGAFSGDTGVLIAGVVIVAIAATLFVISIPTLIGNIIQATATAARVEDLRHKLLRGAEPAAFRDAPPPRDRAMLTLAFAF